MDETIKRINELARKSRESGLTEEEKEEQQRLRQKYIQAFRASLESTLDTVYVEEEDGQAVPIKEYMKEKYGGAEAEKN
ncbi:MAG: DUF896 domain-containing protein [Clostridiales bacterium]|nr:DUF896 domain-containing protein [Clostridiales bacterium]